LTVYFKGDVMERFESDPLPTEAEFVASLDTVRKDVKVPVLEAAPESLKDFAVPVAGAPKVADLPSLPSSYPPLEATTP
ncbi:MAG: outer membrane protein assembly factor BamE, partial [Betaproteobacteria bacterium]